ncbi:MAG: nucleotidyltransferase domain-containing protein [Candidatus Competibacteraceae bacterium]
MPTASELTPQQVAAYRTAARQRWQREQQALQQRQARAWELAHRAADLLKTRFGASRVVVFGSLVRENCFTPWSDVDIAAWSILPKDTFRAIGTLLELDPAIIINLVPAETCRPALSAAIAQEGIDL